MMAILRNLAISLLRLADYNNIAAAIRRMVRADSIIEGLASTVFEGLTPVRPFCPRYSRLPALSRRLWGLSGASRQSTKQPEPTPRFATLKDMSIGVLIPQLSPSAELPTTTGPPVLWPLVSPYTRNSPRSLPAPSRCVAICLRATTSEAGTYSLFTQALNPVGHGH
jgi:hypothetical protein